MRASELSATRRRKETVPGDVNHIAAGKGDRSRISDKDQFDDGYDAINWASKER